MTNFLCAISHGLVFAPLLPVSCLSPPIKEMGIGQGKASGGSAIDFNSSFYLLCCFAENHAVIVHPVLFGRMEGIPFFASWVI